MNEAERNARFAPPDDRQMRWHIQHIREDLRLLCYLVGAGVCMLAVIAFR